MLSTADLLVALRPLHEAQRMDGAVRREQLAQMLEYARPALVLATAAALILGHHLGKDVPQALLVAWLVARVALAGVRMASVSWALSDATALARRWRVTLALLGVDGLLWGVAGAYMANAAPTTLAVAVGALACVSCVATFGLQTSLSATALFAAGVLVPTAVALLARGDELGVVTAICLALVWVLQLVTARQSQRQLDDRVRLRWQAAQLVQQKQEALRLVLEQSDVKSRFLGRVTHELRTPLHGMLGLARLVAQDVPADSRSARWLDLLQTSGQHLLALINDLLDVSRSGNDRVQVQAAPFDVHEAIAALTELHAVRAHAKGLAFELDWGLPIPCVARGDERRLVQVLHNLLGNAVKFTPSGAVTLRVTAASAGWLRFDVVDTGPGIAETEQARVFQAFERGARAPRAGAPDAVEGVGLGLAIAREVANAMGGDVTLTSEPPHGATFTLVAPLPLDASPGPEQRAASAGEPAAAAPGVQADAAPPRVLLAEDDEVNAVIATACLEGMGLQVMRARDGAEAVALVDQHQVDLVLMDCSMPLLDGYEATRRLREGEAAQGRARTPVIALTATVTDEARQRCMQAGMDDFLAKPCAPDDIRACVGRWLARRDATLS